MTNAKMMADVWKIGVRVRADEEGIVRSDEVKRCIEMVMRGEERGEEMRRNAKKWEGLAREVGTSWPFKKKKKEEGGCSDENLKAFVGEGGGDN
ncbi:hypothetical protein RHMOL_Rhmol02G0073600 [Rhododendron molle]|uniref:Uncharacterized protein n=1 Tax=Rhododendron molle TaxID=49168 RepID=A0ACC0PP83_RHOML|nr:hypothetical protein RHMOL_Rhmol02G0073600 [Rhododendron molle]